MIKHTTNAMKEESPRLLHLWQTYPLLFAPEDLITILDQLVQMQNAQIMLDFLQSETSKQIYASIGGNVQKVKRI